jgi:hypothetical protein
MPAGWTPDKFSRRRYVVEGDTLDKAKRIELIVKVDGKPVVQMQAREPGMLAFVSKPADQGFEIDVVEAVGKRYIDHMAPGDPPEAVADWQYEALGMGRPSDG